MMVHDIFIDDDMVWQNIVRETDEWLKIQYEILKKVPPDILPSELDFQGLLGYLEGMTFKAFI